MEEYQEMSWGSTAFAAIFAVGAVYSLNDNFSKVLARFGGLEQKVAVETKVDGNSSPRSNPSRIPVYAVGKTMSVGINRPYLSAN
jgi:hypothetical protein